jgi:hypothetical protein
MRLQRYLNEIKITRKFDLKKMSAFTGKGTNFSRSVKIGKYTYDIEIIASKLPKEYDISFGIIGKPLDVLGTGSAFKVFAAVAQAIKDFLKAADKRNEPVDTLIFTAATDQPSRVKLYDRFAKNFEKMFGFRFIGKEDIGGFDIEYEFKRVT